jgi:RimJ/RimL family protein N-acetyltransferase
MAWLGRRRRSSPGGVRPALGNWSVPHPFWPLFDLRVRTPRLEVRLPTDDELAALIELADAGIHDPSTMPFSIPWTDAPAPRRQREALQWFWGRRAGWQPEEWTLTGGVFVDGRPVGVQDLSATGFEQQRTVTTGSWLGRSFQGRGLGREMRAAVLHLAFAGLGAREARSAAFHDNAASLATSRSLGYVDAGEHWELRRGRQDRLVDLRLDRATWERGRRADIEIVGLAPCLGMFRRPASDEPT